MTCPKCGGEMRPVPDSEWHLWDVRRIDYICPNCLHVETRETIVLRERGK